MTSPSDGVTAPGVGLGHLFGRVALVEARVRAMVEHRRRDDPAPDDPFRGLYLTDDDVDRILAARTPGPPRDDAELQAVEQAAGGSRLRALQEACGLTDLDVEILLAALVPDLDARFERLYGYLNDDVTRRRATVGLALEIGAARPTAAAARGRLAAGAPLVQHLLVTVEEPVDVVVGQVEAAERVVGRGVVAAAVLDHRPHPCLDQRDPREQVPEADTGAGCVGR